MSTDLDPIVDNWYFHLDKGQRFLVVAIDADRQSVEIQHFDGDLEEVDLNEWYEMDIAISEAPENWSGPIDVTERDDYGTEITDTRPEDWTDPLKEFRKPGQEKAIPEPEESPGDDWGEGLTKEEPLEDET